MYLCMELLYIFTMELVLVGIYLSVKSLRKPVDYQWNTIYFVFILEIPPGYIDNRKELGHGLGYGPNSDLHKQWNSDMIMTHCSQVRVPGTNE
jgi:hypothetical protein